jgi:hypothetical protein
VKQKEERTAQQWVAWEKQQKEIGRQVCGCGPLLPCCDFPIFESVFPCFFCANDHTFYSIAQEEMMRRLAAGANSGRASTAEKTLERLKAEGTFVEKPFVPKKR